MDGVVILTKVEKKARVRAMDVVSDLHVRNAISGNLLAGVARTYSLRPRAGRQNTSRLSVRVYRFDHRLINCIGHGSLRNLLFSSGIDQEAAGVNTVRPPDPCRIVSIPGDFGADHHTPNETIGWRLSPYHCSHALLSKRCAQARIAR